MDCLCSEHSGVCGGVFAEILLHNHGYKRRDRLSVWTRWLLSELLFFHAACLLPLFFFPQKSRAHSTFELLHTLLTFPTISKRFSIQTTIPLYSIPALHHCKLQHIRSYLGATTFSTLERH